MQDIIRLGNKRNFFIVDNGVFDKRLNLEPLDKLIYICLLRYADNNTREAFPGQQKIAEDVGISRQRVNTGIAILAEKGLIAVKQRFDKTGSQKSNLYVVYDANEVINRVSPKKTGGVNEKDRGCQQKRLNPVNQNDTKNTYLEIPIEKEHSYTNERDINLESDELKVLDISSHIKQVKDIIMNSNDNSDNDVKI